MFEDILKTVKEHLAEHPQVAAAIPADQQDAVHQEIASHIANNLPAGDAPAAGGMLGGLMGKLEGAIASGGPMVNAIEGGLVGSLANKFGLGPAATGAISAAIPGLLQKFAARQQG